VIRSWAGVVENTPDGRPVIERLQVPDNTVLVSLSSIGFGLSPATGRAVQQRVTQRRCDFADLSTLSLSRFDGIEQDWAELLGWRTAPGRGTAAGSA
jgi:sarcosine oxidase, subunit beta